MLTVHPVPLVSSEVAAPNAASEIVPDVLLRLGSDLCFLYVSPSLLEAVGTPSESLLGRRIAECLQTPPVTAAWEPAVREVLRSGRTQEIECVFALPAGERAFQVRLMPERSRGAVTTVLCIARDVTAARQAEQALCARIRFLEALALRGQMNGANEEIPRPTNLVVDAPARREQEEMTDETADVSLPASRVPLAKTSAHVLVIDGNMAEQTEALLLLGKLGCRVDGVTTELEALSLVEARQYDIILLDCRNPEADLYRTAAEIRRLEAPGRVTPIVAVTTDRMPGARERCFAAGMDACLYRPLREEELRKTFTALLGAPSAAVPSAMVK